MRKWWPLVAICLGTFMLLMDVTIVNVALPAISYDLRASISALQWVMDAYALVLAALLLTAGACADLLGRRRMYLTGLTVFAAASLVCGLAPSAGALVVGRALQGLGGAIMFATTTALLTSVYSGRERVVAFSAWGAVSGSATATGPVLGGLLSQRWGWPTIFLVNLPVAVLTMALARRVLPEYKSAAGRRFDAPGAVTFTVAAGAVVAGLISSSEKGRDDDGVLALLALGGVALLLFLVVELSSAQPMLDLRLFRRPAFSGLMLSALLLQGTAFGHLGYTSLWLQSSLHMQPLAAGLVLAPLSLSGLLVSSLGGRFLQGLPARVPVSCGLLLIGIGVLSQAMVGPHSGWTALLPGLVLTGIGAGGMIPPLTAAALASVPQSEAGTASGAVNTFRQLGQAIGVAVLGSVFVHAAGPSLDHVTDNPLRAAAAVGSGQSDRFIDAAAPNRRGVVADAVHAAFVSGLQQVFLIAGSAAVVTGIAAWFLLKDLDRDRTPAAAEGASTGASNRGPEPPFAAGTVTPP
ncbi:MFS transporter [Streptomyces sp. Je 1-369]|uniref:MFS transporter n=1 Tax=Streptomyces sp. Je 1-369 TaxID=2966192 RepID=UPI00228655FA|nr:MFS transporter [Streptomyces sp. Je 1-369]WAL93653.1 MFS transporter [Streptomyces sp. Je 1-369]